MITSKGPACPKSARISACCCAQHIPHGIEHLNHDQVLGSQRLAPHNDGIPNRLVVGRLLDAHHVGRTRRGGRNGRQCGRRKRRRRCGDGDGAGSVGSSFTTCSTTGVSVAAAGSAGSVAISDGTSPACASATCSVSNVGVGSTNASLCVGPLSPLSSAYESPADFGADQLDDVPASCRSLQLDVSERVSFGINL